MIVRLEYIPIILVVSVMETLVDFEHRESDCDFLGFFSGTVVLVDNSAASDTIIDRKRLIQQTSNEKHWASTRRHPVL